MGAWANLPHDLSKLGGFFFFEKKKQKTFGRCWMLASEHPTGDNSLLVLFFKEEHSF
jgi:hypothetical protein